MHLLAAQKGTVSDGAEAVDLGQTPGDIVFLSAADTELACLAAAHDRLGTQAPSLRLANLLSLGHNLSVDLYVETVVSKARLVVVRLLGGVRYWSYGVEQVAEACRRGGIPVAFLPGDDQPDPELARLTTLPAEAAHTLWQYLAHGGLGNAVQFLEFCRDGGALPPAPLARALLYWPGLDWPTLDDLRGQWRADAPVTAIIFYRALVQAANLEAIDALIGALKAKGLNPLPIAVTSLKDKVVQGVVESLYAQAPPDVILNATAFAVNQGTPAPALTLQVVLASTTEGDWRNGTQGLAPRDIAMNVALPEVDGRILVRAIAFKADARRHQATQSWIVIHKPAPDRVRFTAELAAAWARLRRTPAAARRVAILLANYPNRDGRLANGVGLDTPAGVARTILAMRAAGYDTADAPTSSAGLMAALTHGVTNDFRALDDRDHGEILSLDAYRRFFAKLPPATRQRITDRWGNPDSDPFVRNGAFRLPLHRFGSLVVGVQPARGYNIDPVRTYHDPDLAPPHNYLAVYAWLRREFDAHAVVHFGKHGNLEWLPGKALALSQECFPEVILGAMPHLYPFIVNDPGEGTQAKRRAAAVIIDHLTPPLTRAETYGPLRQLEMLVDEYYEAANLDPRRLPVLARDILELAGSIGLDRDVGVGRDDDPDAALTRIDNHLCELKELQIRDGLHVFGEAPAGDRLIDLLVALVRLPRQRGEGKDASLIRALAADLKLEDFDPLDCPMAESWTGPRPAALATPEPWRTCGDTVERLELLARALVAGIVKPDDGWTRTRDVLAFVADWLRPTVIACGDAEIAGLLQGLDGRFVPPGPSGAPTRGRPEVLPTGRNFFSVDTRAVPTPAAWTLGWKSATRVIERHMQEHGEWPRVLALSAWGTANMRTGGDDIAQALALLGVRPTWDVATGRVTGFEILPLSVLDRPRVDVTLRVSGFFRDAFPAQIDLVDSASRAVASLDEPEDMNPLAARFRADRAALVATGVTPEDAAKRAGYRVFGSKPGAYGAGLQALIDERGWTTDADLAQAYLAWGAYAYGAGAEGAPERALFETRMGAVEAVLHNQDNREHDLLDSDDYYQFEGGLAVTIKHLKGTAPTVYHNDHSRPESPQIRTLDEEIARVVRGRVVNPKWIAGVMRHGYKGAFEMAATVDYLFAFAATTGAVKDHHFDAVYDAFVTDDAVRDFMADTNPAAQKEMADRLLEAQDRGLWRPKSNSAHGVLAELAGKGGKG
ncbi:MAG TPA: cobaltochelatase subunit CobN [Azospirillaceae bacterium]|nr:cobaltochelatase subunit CobN [Azospirillaceae bacterium]